MKITEAAHKNNAKDLITRKLKIVALDLSCTRASFVGVNKRKLRWATKCGHAIGPRVHRNSGPAAFVLTAD